MIMNVSVNTHQSIDTGYNADSLEWSPLASHEDLMLCGTYQLQEGQKDEESSESTPQTRVGRLYLYSLDLSTLEPRINLQTSLDMPGILDTKWSYVTLNDLPTFALVNSVGQLRVYSVAEGNTITMVIEEELTPHSLGLSLEWNNMTCCSNSTQIVSSDSSGSVHVHQLTPTDLEPISSWKAHDYEAWIAAFNQYDTSIVYTGGDDCKLKAWDMRCDTTMPVFTSKRHTMGVCSIQSNPVKSNILATGSYDEQLLLWDTRNMKRPTNECTLGGGVWRVKWEPKMAAYILTATMYNGFHIVNTKGPDEDLPVLCHYKEHESIAYGADWCRISSCDKSKISMDAATQSMGYSERKNTGSDKSSDSTQKAQPTGFQVSEGKSCGTGEEYTLATCSFYDHLLKLWTLKVDK